jgi:glycerophosphoryl diester phosphodiesterase
MPQPASSTPGPQWIGHRGAPGKHLENTLDSFLEAFHLGADAVELDVHVTADGVPVVHHDPKFGSVEPARYRAAHIHTMTLADVGAIELAGGSKVPTLESVLDAVGSKGTVYVEIKGGSELPVAEVIRASGAMCAVHSFDHAAIARLQTVAPSIPRGILFDSLPPDLEAIISATRARDVWPAWRLVDSKLVDAVHQLHGRVIPWTVNTKDAAADLARLGVDGICSDDIPAIRS